MNTPKVVRSGRGRARPQDLPAAAASLMDDQAARTEARRQRIREEAKNVKPAGVSEFWQRLRAARAYAQKTQRELANEMGVSRGAVALWEMEHAEYRTIPGVDTVNRIAAFLRVSPAYLLDDNVKPEDVWQMSSVPRAGVISTRAVAVPAPTPVAAAPAAAGLSPHAVALGQLLDQVDKSDVVAFAQLYQNLTQQILNHLGAKSS